MALARAMTAEEFDELDDARERLYSTDGEVESSEAFALWSDKAALGTGIRRNTKLTTTARLVAAELIHFLNYETGACFPSNETIAQALNLTARGVRNSIADLEEAGCLVREIRPGGRFTNRVHFNWRWAVRPNQKPEDTVADIRRSARFDALRRNAHQTERNGGSGVGGTAVPPRRHGGSAREEQRRPLTRVNQQGKDKQGKDEHGRSSPPIAVGLYFPDPNAIRRLIETATKGLDPAEIAVIDREITRESVEMFDAPGFEDARADWVIDRYTRLLERRIASGELPESARHAIPSRQG